VRQIQARELSEVVNRGSSKNVTEEGRGSKAVKLTLTEREREELGWSKRHASCL